MLKLSSNQMDYDAVTSIYTHSLGLIKTAIGKSKAGLAEAMRRPRS